MVQSSKVRCIDNYNESQVNDAVIVMCEVTVYGTDTIAAMMAESMRTLKEQGKQSTSLSAKSFNFKSAYRQLAIADDSLPWARVCVLNPPKVDVE